jgi:ribosomal protein L7/L12
MAEALVCPTCGYPLTPPDPYAVSMQCPACKNFIIIPKEAAPVRQPAAQDEMTQKIVALWRIDRKIEAIKLYRQIYQVGLAEAKDGVERMAQQALPAAAGGVHPNPGSGVEMYSWDRPAAQPGEPTARAAAMGEVKAALDSGNKIQAIKVFREAFGTDLRTAKLAVDQLERGHFAQAGNSAGAAPSGAPSRVRRLVLRMVVFDVVILILIVLFLLLHKP